MRKIIKTIACLMTFLSIYSVDAATLSIGSDTTTAGALNKSVSLELLDDETNPNLKEFVKLQFELNISGTAYAEINFSYSGSMTYKPEGKVYTIESPTGLYESTLGTISYSTTSELDGPFEIKPVNVKFIKEDGSVLVPGDQGIKVKEGIIKFEKPKSTDASLTSLTVSQGVLTPAFASDVTDYTVQVKDTISLIKILAEPCLGATKTGTGNKTLNIGENVFEVEVTAEDGVTKKTYYINVVRGEITEPSAYITDLTINNIGVDLDSEFDSKNNKYTVTVGKEITKLDFKIELEDPLATYEIEGNEKFILGQNLVKINVVSSDGTLEQTYEITVTQEEEQKEEVVLTPPTDEKPSDDSSKENNNTLLIVAIVSVVVVILVGVSVLLFGKKKKKKENVKLPLKKRDHSEPTVSEEMKKVKTPDLFEDDRTQKFDSKAFREVVENYDDEELDKTKEFNFKNFE